MSWSLFGGPLPVWSTIAFRIWQNHYTWEVQHIMRCTKNCNACSWHWSAERTQFFSWQCLTACCPTNAFKVEWTGLWSFASSSVFTWPLANWLSLLQTSQQLFTGKMLPQPAGGTQCFPTVHQIPKHGFLLYRNKQTYFSLAKICWF